MPGLPQIQPPYDPEQPELPAADLFATLRRIDGWGPGAWSEVVGLFSLPHGRILIDRGGPDDGADEADATILVLAPVATIPGLAADPTGGCDWILRRARSDLLPVLGLRAALPDPGDRVLATTACRVAGGDVALRLRVRLPYTGMCIDAQLLAAAVRRIADFLHALARGPRPGLRVHLRSLARQRHLRAALTAHGLIAFVADGDRLARGPSGPAKACIPCTAPAGLAVELDVRGHGRIRGLGIRAGVTVLVGAPYHGKSTLLSALAQGWCDRPVGDGREGTVAIPGALAVQAEEGRPIGAQDLSPFFGRLPGGEVDAFTTARASGATSMAASALQGIAAGSRLLLIDEDTAAGNVLAVDGPMRTLLGTAFTGNRTLAELLPALSRQGISSVVVAGASSAILTAADRIIELRDFLPRDATRRARRILAEARVRAVAATCRLPPRSLHDDPDRVLGYGHFLRVDVAEAERPELPGGHRIDLRRSGWPLDPWLARGAVLAAAWCLRLADGRPMSLEELGGRYERLIAEHGPAALDPFHTDDLSVPPWQLVVSVLERMPQVALSCVPGTAGFQPARNGSAAGQPGTAGFQPARNGSAAG